MSEKPIRKRYSKEEKAEIVSFVKSHNAKNKRGGITAAAAKFGATPVTIGSWLKKDSGAAPAKSTSRGGSKEAKTVHALSEVLSQIEEKEAELQKLRKKYDTLKGKL